MNKNCSKCLQTKPTSEFGPDPRSKDGLKTQCRACLLTYQRERKRSIKKGTWAAADQTALSLSMKEQGLYYCAKCKEFKPKDAFWKGLIDGRQPYCIECLKRDRHENPKPVRATEAKHVQTLRRAAMDAYGGRFCKCCGETIERFLTIDHMNGGGIQHRKELGGGQKLYPWLQRNNYPEGFQILCFNCNCGRYLNGGICPHLDQE